MSNRLRTCSSWRRFEPLTISIVSPFSRSPARSGGTKTHGHALRGKGLFTSLSNLVQPGKAWAITAVGDLVVSRHSPSLYATVSLRSAVFSRKKNGPWRRILLLFSIDGGHANFSKVNFPLLDSSLECELGLRQFGELLGRNRVFRGPS